MDNAKNKADRKKQNRFLKLLPWFVLLSFLIAVISFVAAIKTTFDFWFGVFVISFFSSFVLAVISKLLIKLGWIEVKHPTGINLVVALGILYLGVIIFANIFLGPSVRRHRAIGTEKAMSEARSWIKETVFEYVEDNNGFLPEADRWCDILMEYDKSLIREDFKNPEILEGDCDIAFNKHLSGLKLSDVPGDVVLLFSANGEWNLNGGEELFRSSFRKNKDLYFKYIILANGEIEPFMFDAKFMYFVTISEESEPLRWEP